MGFVVYRGVLLELEFLFNKIRRVRVLIHCISWSAFGEPKVAGKEPDFVVLIHCISWSAFGVLFSRKRISVRKS